MTVGPALPSTTLSGPTLQAFTPEARAALRASVVALIQSGQAATAVGQLQGALTRLPPDPDLLHLAGLAARAAGDLTAATGWIGRAVALAPRNPDYQNSFGVVLRGQGFVEEAIAAYRRALAEVPDHPDTLSNLANALEQTGRPNEAADALLHLRRLPGEPPNGRAALALRLGKALHAAERFDEARHAFHDALLRDPGSADAHNNLALSFRRLGDPEKAERHYRHALRLTPTDPTLWSNAAIALRTLGRVEDSVAACERALLHDPQHPGGHFNRSIGLLLLGRLAEGWAEYEWRWRTGVMIPRGFSHPLWTGEPFTGRTLLIHAEQGFGDTLQFVRLLDAVKARGGRVVLEAQESLLSLLWGVAGIDQLVAAGKPLPPFDLQCPLLSLPGVLGIDANRIPANVPYLRVPPARAVAWTDRFQHLEPTGRARRRIGLVWSGNPKHTNDAQRSMPVSHLATLTNTPGTRFYSLQVGGRADHAERPAGLVDLAPALSDFTETAAALAQLDLLITVDTSVAHLAGALGRPVWLLLALDCDWRWMLKRGDSPWYPTARLFRQPTPGDWAPVIAEVAAALRGL